MDPAMMSVEAELLAVERDFSSGRCGAFEDAGAQQDVAKQLQQLRALENDLFAQSRAIFEWNGEEQALWEQAMHRPQQASQNVPGATPTTGATPGYPGQPPQQQQQQQQNGADQLASLFGKRDQALRNVSSTVRAMTKSISTCGDVVSHAGGARSSGSGGGGGGGGPSSSSAGMMPSSSSHQHQPPPQQFPGERGAGSNNNANGGGRVEDYSSSAAAAAAASSNRGGSSRSGSNQPPQRDNSGVTGSGLAPASGSGRLSSGKRGHGSGLR